MDISPPAPIADSWVAPLGKFDIEQDATELEGYQMYAVEKWYVDRAYPAPAYDPYVSTHRVVDRSKFMKVVVVFTGDPKDVVSYCR
jgi:hypothetical protein